MFPKYYARKSCPYTVDDDTPGFPLRRPAACASSVRTDPYLGGLGQSFAETRKVVHIAISQYRVSRILMDWKNSSYGIQVQPRSLLGHEGEDPIVDIPKGPVRLHDTFVEEDPCDVLRGVVIVVLCMWCRLGWLAVLKIMPLGSCSHCNAQSLTSFQTMWVMRSYMLGEVLAATKVKGKMLSAFNVSSRQNAR